jgi:hypothetical protein
MADYRDDSLDTLVVLDMTTLGLSNAILQDALRISASLLVGVTVLVTDASAAISDEVQDTRRAWSPVTEALGVDELWVDQLYTKDLVTDTRRITDTVRQRLRVEHSDELVVSDELLGGSVSHISDKLEVSESWSGVLSASTKRTDTLRIADSVGQLFAQTIEDTLTLSDSTADVLRAHERLEDELTVSDELSAGLVTVGHIADGIQILDTVSDHLDAVQFVTDWLGLSDSTQVDAGSGQIWVANTDGTGWPMSRYTISATSIAVINDVVHVTTPEGVFALDGEDEGIEAFMKTGRVNMGQQGPQLGVPVSMYLEYELASDDPLLEVGVTQYQSGASADTWTYALPTEPGETLTNGRVKFGKGLRGRHFTFDISITAQRSYLNEISVLFAPGKRRI